LSFPLELIALALGDGLLRRDRRKWTRIVAQVGDTWIGRVDGPPERIRDDKTDAGIVWATEIAAALRDGRKVVVKVQRSGIRKQIAEDLEVLEEFLESIDLGGEGGGVAEEVVNLCGA